MIKGIDRVPVSYLYIPFFNIPSVFTSLFSFCRGSYIIFNFFPLLFAYHLLLPRNKNHCITQPSTPFFPSSFHWIARNDYFSFRSIFDIVLCHFAHFSFNFRTSELRFFVSTKVANFSFRWLEQRTSLCRHCCFRPIFNPSLPFNFLELGRKEFFHTNRFITRFIKFWLSL